MYFAIVLLSSVTEYIGVSMYFLFSVLIACRPSISLKITHPADVTIDPQITKIAVVDRVNNEHTRKAIAGFLQMSQNVDLVRFQVVDGQQIYEDLAAPVNGPIPNDSMQKLCSSSNVKGALVLHRFKKDDGMDVSRRDEQVTLDGKVQTKTIFTAEYSANLSTDWRFRGCDGQTYDSFLTQSSERWTADGDTPGDAKSNMGETKDLSLQIANALGTDYFKRVSPSETYEYRRLYRGPIGPKGKRFREGVNLTKDRRYNKAKVAYQSNMEGFSTRVKGKAFYNMAILHESLGEYDRMVQKAKKSDGILQSRKSSRYLEYTKSRRQSERKLKHQMEKAGESNSQDNR